MNAHIIDDQDALLNYLYEEGDAAERLKVARHLQNCAACSVAVLELQSVRGMLADWAPPPVKLGFRIVSEDSERAARKQQWWQPSGRMPAWAQAAAAVLVFAAGMAVSQLDVQYGNGALTLRSRGTAPAALNEESAGTVVPVGFATRRNDIPLAPEAPTNASFAALEQQLRNDLNGRADADDILRRVRAMIDQSEARQQRELALRLADVVRDFDAQRRADLLQVQQNFGQLEGQTGQEVAHQRELLNYLVRTSGAR